MGDSSSSHLNHLAIDAALEGRFKDALKLNKKILRLDSQNVDALARLARAFMELGRFNLAKRYYSQVLKYDPYNPIAVKNLKIIKGFKVNGHPQASDGQQKLTSALFLQEPGKTKLVNLLKVAEPSKLSRVFCGMKVIACVKNRKITVSDTEGGYLGVLPDDICHLLIRLLRGGNKYEFFIKSIKVNGLQVLIKEVFRSKRFKNQPSFLEGTTSSFISEMHTFLEEDGGEEESLAESEEPQV